MLGPIVDGGKVEAGGGADEAEHEADGLECHVQLDALEHTQGEDAERENDEPCEHHDESVTWVGKVVVHHDPLAGQLRIFHGVVEGDGVIPAAVGSFCHVHRKEAVVGVSSQRAAQRSSRRGPARLSEREDKGLRGVCQIEFIRCEVCAVRARTGDKVHAILVYVGRPVGRRDLGELNGVGVGGLNVTAREAWG